MIDPGWRWPPCGEGETVSRLNDLLRQLRMDRPALADDLQSEFDVLADRRSFGLNFERHVPEAVELPGRRVRKGDKVRALPPRGDKRMAGHDRLWRVIGVTTENETRVGSLISLDEAEDEVSVAVDDLVVVAEFRDPIYPGLVSTGKVERGGDKPFHSVINAENFYALQALLFTHRGKIDAIYVDPPYNSGSTDWKYNNDYVESDDHYRHSKWLAFMERRLKLAKELLNPDDSVLIVTIDHNEQSRLGLLLEQVFPEARMQMVTSVINPRGKYRANDFSRCEEYIYFLAFGDALVCGEPDDDFGEGATVAWRTFRRSDIASRRGSPKGGTSQFFPIYVNGDGVVERIGEALPHDLPRSEAPEREGCTAVFPIRNDGTEMNWGSNYPGRRAVVGARLHSRGQAHAEQAAGMGDLLSHVRSHSGYR